ncbi:MAG: 4-hydroxy-tetrahydrodipicolinate synthase, partial [Clostridia bacterium]
RERTAVAAYAIKKADGKVPVVLGAGSNNTYTAVEYAIEAEELGADAILAVTPYYNKCTQKGIIGHYTAIADAVNIPVIMYNVPSRTGVNINAETALELSAHKNITAIKEASGNINQFMEVAALTQGKLDLYSGDDGLVYPILALGGIGVISVASNIIPDYMVKMVSSFLEGDTELSRSMQFKANPLIKALFSEVNPIPVKCAARLMKIIKDDYMRLPLTKFSKEDMLKNELAAFGIKV